MWAMIVKEFRQLRRDRRTLAMMIVMPVVLLIVFGYAASFDVTTIPTVVAGPQASQAAHLLGSRSTWWPRAGARAGPGRRTSCGTGTARRGRGHRAAGRWC